MTHHQSVPRVRSYLPRRWLQLRLGTLLVAIAVISAWLAFYVNPRHREKMAIAELQKAGVFVTTASNAPAWAPDWLRRAFFQYVVAVNCWGSNGWRQNDFGQIVDPSEPLSDLQLYVLLEADQGDRHDGRLVTDALMANIAAFKHCKVLYLLNANITDAGLEHLATLRQVQVLQIGGTKITDAGLQHLSNMQRLRHLVLHNTKITDQGCAALQRSIPDCYIAR